MDITREVEILKKLKHHHLSRTEITDKSIWDLQIKMGWHGSGEEFDPIIIDCLSGLKPNIWIHRSSKHYIIHDVIISKLVCTSTQNIVIENSKINELEVEGCYNVTIRNNSILLFNFAYSKGCVIENNSFTNLALENLENNYFNSFHSSMQKGLYSVMSLFAILTLWFFLSSTYLWFIGLLTLGSIAIMYYYISTLNAKEKRTQEKHENKLLGNSALSDIERNEILYEILENYAYLGGCRLKYNLPTIIGGSIGGVVALIIAFITYG